MIAGDDEKRPWPPVHDEAGLADAIAKIASNLPKDFYLDSIEDAEPCQGDVLEINAEVPVLDSDGEVTALEHVQYWLVVANSCDVSRDEDYAPIVPMLPMSTYELNESTELAVRKYQIGRMFYVPPWPEVAGPQIADFSQFVSIHRDALRSRAQVRARMKLESWILLNACLTRLLCREDRRYL